jgi:predicted kinase
MSKPKMIMMVGLPASGKSTKAEELAEIYNANIHASDTIREELSGDINNQNINELVFKTLHNRIKEDLMNGKSCIYDATNISYKRRMAFLNELNKIPCEKYCFLMATPYEQCLKNNDNRDRKLPKEVIERMYRHFDVPWYYEGWDDIWVQYAPNSQGCYGYPVHWIETVRNYNQNNTHHSLSLGEHCEKAWKYMCEHNGNLTLRIASILHDCGKPFAKTFTNSKGEITEQAHYYNHERLSSYDSLFYTMLCNSLEVAVLIRWHMQPYFWEKDNNEKSHNKYKQLWGENLYKDIMLLHEADKQAH